MTLNNLKNEKIATVKATTMVEAIPLSLEELMAFKAPNPWDEGAYTVKLDKVVITRFDNGLPKQFTFTFVDSEGKTHTNKHSYPTSAHKPNYPQAFCITMGILCDNLELDRNTLFQTDFEQQLQSRIGHEVHIVATSKLMDDGNYKVFAEYATKQQVIERLSQATMADLSRI